ncbi:MAG: hypothetical protein IT445_03190 [Phycisphaeraceae bacterium]|nr:hypothetical protein [Phycisphaeraceae bacterium]
MRLILLIVTLLLAGSPALARVKLITLPVRQRVLVQLDHEQATLVEEERIVPLVKGVNQVDFSWAGTSIDPHTIVFRLLEPVAAPKATQAEVLAVSYPPGENALVWDVSASASGSFRVRISYLLGGLSKSFNYRAVAEHDESTLTLSQYLRVENFANEAFDDTSIQLGFGDSFEKPIGVNETREMLVAKLPGVPIRKTYTCDVVSNDYLDAGQKKVLIPMHYVLTNDTDHKLGQAALPYGKVRVFQKDTSGGTAFTGEDWGQFTPIDDEMKLYLGVAQDVVVKRTIARRDRTPIAGNLSNYDVAVQYEIENFKDTPVTLDIVEHPANLRGEAGFNSDRGASWTLGDQHTLGAVDAEHSDIEQATFHVELPARKGDKAEKITHKLHLVYRNEWN